MYILVMPRFFVVAASFSLDIFSLLSAVAAQIRADPIDQGILIEGEGSVLLTSSSVCARRSTVLNFPPQEGFPARTCTLVVEGGSTSPFSIPWFTC